MEKPLVAIESLRMRAEEFRTRAADCAIPRYSELMHKGAAHLDERARMLEAGVGPAQLRGINETDR